jgi:hypothetical protein
MQYEENKALLGTIPAVVAGLVLAIHVFVSRK